MWDMGCKGGIGDILKNQVPVKILLFPANPIDTSSHSFHF